MEPVGTDGIQPDEDLPSDAFFVERHVADVMPAAHWHDHVEINYLPRGQMEYLLNGRRAALAPRRLGVFWAAVHHQAISVGEEQQLVCAYIPIVEFLRLPVAASFRATLLRGELIQTRDECSWAHHSLVPMSEKWATTNRALRQVFREELLLRLRRMALEPILADSREAAADALPGSDRANPRLVAHVETMTAYINAHISRPFRVSDVTRATGLHQTSAMAAFRKVLGLSIGQYVRRRRLSQAMYLLTNTDRAIADIAHSCGYSSLTRLYDAFHSQVGRTPRRYRQDIKKFHRSPASAE